jgi:hypothetical protein
LNNLIIYIEAHKHQPMNFGNKIISHLRKHYKNNTLLDLDNFSAPDLFSHALTACKEEQKIKLIIKVEEQEITLGPILQFINKLIRITSLSIDAVLIGEHLTLKRMLSKMNSFEECSSDALIQKIKHKKTSLN